MNQHLHASMSDADYKQLRLKWYRLLTGGDYPLDNPYIMKKIALIDEKATKDLEDMVPSSRRTNEPYIWEDLKPPNLPPKDKSANMHVKLSYMRLEPITLACVTKGSRYYKNQEVISEIIAALDFMYTHWYNENIQGYGNWWVWDIGVPLALNNMTIMLYDDLSETQRNNYMKAIHHFTADITSSTGANLVWKAIIISILGIITKNPERILYGRDAMNTVYPYVTSGDGFYEDGSFIQHTYYGYTGNYGEALINNMTKFVYLLSDSPCAITHPGVRNLYKWIVDSFEPLIYKGAFMDALRGRQISGYQFYDHNKGQLVIEIIALAATFAPEPYKTRYKKMVKSYMIEDWYTPYFEQASIYGVLLGQAILDSDLEPRPPLEGTYIYSAMDRIVYRHKDYACLIAMHSNRIRNYEQINAENLRGWHTGDGMTYLYNGDLKRYGDAFWPTVDSHRLPGTTSIYGEEIPRNSLSDTPWAGGCEHNGKYAVAGMQLHPPGSPLHAKKGWFMFGDAIVCLGSDIHVEASASISTQVETTLANYKLGDLGNNAITIDDYAVDPTPSPTTYRCQADWLHMEGNTNHSDVGYYFPKGHKILYKRETRTDSYASINRYSIVHEEPFTRHYFTLWLDHGMPYEQTDYAYVILPEKSAEEVATYAQSPAIEILANSGSVQGVKDTQEDITGILFWGNDTRRLAGITCSQPACVILRETDNQLALSISDPTWLSSMLSLVVEQPIAHVENTNDKILIDLQQDKCILTIDTTHAMGQSFHIILHKSK